MVTPSPDFLFSQTKWLNCIFDMMKVPEVDGAPGSFEEKHILSHFMRNNISITLATKRT